jgi:hypothetical protein
MAFSSTHLHQRHAEAEAPILPSLGGEQRQDQNKHKHKGMEKQPKGSTLLRFPRKEEEKESPESETHTHTHTHTGRNQRKSFGKGKALKQVGTIRSDLKYPHNQISVSAPFSSSISLFISSQFLLHLS